MILDIDRIKGVLYDDGISGYKIEQATGISRTSIHKYRTGKNDFNNITLDTLLKLSKYDNIQSWIYTNIKIQTCRFDKKKSAQVDF